jgi:hypothetical protein
MAPEPSLHHDDTWLAREAAVALARELGLANAEPARTAWRCSRSWAVTACCRCAIGWAWRRPARLGAGGLVLAALARLRGAPDQGVRVDVSHAAYGLVGFRQIRVAGAPVASPGDANPLVGMYRCRDGAWFALHGGFESLRAPTLRLLGASADAASMVQAVGRRDSAELEESFGAHGLCGVVCRSAQDWQRTPAGRILAIEPLVSLTRIGDGEPTPLARWEPGQGALAGVRVLDFTRILAGPTCGRMMAAAGAQVLVPVPARLPNIPGYALETGAGKRFMEVDLDEPVGREQALALADSCDVLVDSFRSGSLARRGLGAQALAARRAQPRAGHGRAPASCASRSTATATTGPGRRARAGSSWGKAATGLLGGARGGRASGAAVDLPLRLPHGLPRGHRRGARAAPARAGGRQLAREGEPRARACMRRPSACGRAASPMAPRTTGAPSASAAACRPPPGRCATCPSPWSCPPPRCAAGQRPSAFGLGQRAAGATHESRARGCRAGGARRLREPRAAAKDSTWTA